ncbi:MAG: hypothetical protein KRP56_06195 [Candidatus Methanogranum gryphiswaldense]|nr:MAG: hypothetical protein KRP56_06195 [Candidatus Methanogranum sp. U3.2.1]
MEKKTIAIFSTIVVSLFFVMLAICILTLGDDPDMLLLWSSFLGSTLTLFVLISASLIYMRSPSETYKERYGSEDADQKDK